MNTRTSAFRRLAIISLSALALGACENKATTTIVPKNTQVALTPSSATLAVGQTTTFIASVSDDTTGANSGVTFSSSNTAVASVAQTGVVTAVAPGVATIIATSKFNTTKSAGALVTVNPAVVVPVAIAIIPTSAQLTAGNTLPLVVQVTGPAGVSQAVTYTTSDATVATVTGTTATNGVVTATQKNGTAVITATATADPTKTATSVITVVGGSNGVTSIVITPTTQTVNVGDVFTFVATVSGNSNTAKTFTSSDPTVATINATTGVATAIKAGTTVITATSTGDATKSATATLTVASSTQPSISISSVTAAGVSVPVGSAVAGPINVNMNVVAGSQTSIQRVATVVTGPNGAVEACTQTFTPPLAPTQGVAPILCPITTNQLNADGTAKFPNGTYALSAVAFNSAGAQVAQASYGNITFANANAAAVTINTSKVSSATGSAIGGATSVAPGLLWNEGDVVVTVTPTMFAGGTVSSATVCLNPAGAAVSTGTAGVVALPVGTDCRTSNAPVANVFTITFPKASSVAANGVASVEATGVTAGVTTVTAAGANGPAAVSNSIRLDNFAPIATTITLPANIYVNDAFSFGGGSVAAGTGTGFASADLGGDAATVVFNVLTTSGAAVAGGAGVTNSSGVPETTTSTQYVLQAVMTDNLGNSRSVFASATGSQTLIANASAFGVDRTIPTITVAGPANNSTNSTNTYNYTFSDPGNPPNGGPSGFGGTPLSIKVEQFTPNGTGGVVVTCLGALTGTPIGGGGLGTGCGGAAAGFQTVADAATDVILPTGSVDAYFRVTARATDFAKNVSADLVRTTLNDDAGAPTIGFIQGPTSITGGQSVSFSSQMSDNVDLGDVLGYVGYNGTLFLTAPPQTIGTYGFDILSTPLTTTYTIDQFIRSVETTTANFPTGTAAISQATSADLAVRDVAGVAKNVTCPAAGTVAPVTGATGGCTTASTNIGGAVSLGMNSIADSTFSGPNRPFGTVTASNPNGGGTAFTFAAAPTTVCSDNPVGGAAGCAIATSTTLTSTATGPAQTFANPFNRVNFYYTDALGRSVLIGTAAVSVTDNTVTATRTWKYTFSWSPTIVAGTYNVFALGVDAQGRALKSGTVAVTVTSD